MSPRPPHLPSLPDEELVERYRHSHDNRYIGELYVRYDRLVYGVALKYLKDHDAAADALMAIFEKLMDDLKKHPVETFRPWFYVLAKNHCLQMLRSSKRARDRQERYADDLSSMESAAQEHPTAEDRERWLQTMESCLPQLKDDQRTCIELFYLKQMSYKEIGEQTGFSFKQVKSHIQNGRRNLERMMRSETDDE